LHLEKNKRYMSFAWFVCGIGAIFYSYEYFLRISPSVMESALRSHYTLSAGGFGLLSSFYYYAYVPMQIPVGILMDRYGPRRLLTLACFICAMGTILFAATQSFYISALGRFLVGLGSAFAFVGVLKLATIWLPDDKLALVSGLAAALGTVGAMLGDNLLGWMVLRVGWQETTYITAIFGFAFVFVLWFCIKDKKHHQKGSGTVGNFKKSIEDLAIISKNRQIWINGMYGCLVYLPTTVMAELWGIPYLSHAHGLSQNSADFSNSLLFLGFTIGAPLMGLLSDKLHRRKTPMLIGATGATILMMALLYLPNLSRFGIYSVMFLLGLCYSSQAIVFAVGRELSPREAAGTAMAMTNMIVMLGGMFIQPLIGWLLDWSVKIRQPAMDLTHLTADKVNQMYSAIDYQFALSIIPLGILIAAILTFFLRETHANANR
jgi:MFS family permease